MGFSTSCRKKSLGPYGDSQGFGFGAFGPLGPYGDSQSLGAENKPLGKF